MAGIEQIGNALRFLAFYLTNGVGQAGLTVTIDVYNPAGTLVVTAGAAVEIGGGLYGYTLASGSVLTEGEYVCIFKTATASVDQMHIASAWSVGRAGIENLNASIAAILDKVDTEIAAIKLRTDLIGSGIAVTSMPVASSGALTIIQGDDYANADGRALEWTNALGTWPDLTAATVTLVAHIKGGSLTKAGTVVTPTGVNQKVRFELTAADTNKPLGDWSFDVQATLASVRKVTLVQDTLTISADVAP